MAEKTGNRSRGCKGVECVYCFGKMARDFSFLFVGLILVFVDININAFDILPDFIGYASIAVGAHRLVLFAGSFTPVRNFAWLLVGLSLAAFFTPLHMLPFLETTIGILTLLLIWFLLGATIDFTNERERPDLAEHAVIYRRIYAGIAITALLVAQAARFEPEAASPFAFLAMVATLAILIFILRLLYVVRQELAVNSSI